jgi:hypothetical protein
MPSRKGPELIFQQKSKLGPNNDELVKSQKRVSSRAKRGDLIFASS